MVGTNISMDETINALAKVLAMNLQGFTEREAAAAGASGGIQVGKERPESGYGSPTYRGIFDRPGSPAGQSFYSSEGEQRSPKSSVSIGSDDGCVGGAYGMPVTPSPRPIMGRGAPPASRVSTPLGLGLQPTSSHKDFVLDDWVNICTPDPIPARQFGGNSTMNVAESDMIDPFMQEMCAEVMKMKRRPPADYICKCCARPGHFVQECPMLPRAQDERTPYQGKKQSVGEYQCPKCKHAWTSHFSYANVPQKCKKCDIEVFAKKQRPLSEDLVEKFGSCAPSPVPSIQQSIPRFGRMLVSAVPSPISIRIPSQQQQLAPRFRAQQMTYSGYDGRYAM